MSIKTTEELVLAVLERNKLARGNDFILYGSVLKEMGIDLHISLATFLAKAKDYYYAPSFETVSRCRRKIQTYREDLIDEESQKIREERIEKVIKWSKE